MIPVLISLLIGGIVYIVFQLSFKGKRSEKLNEINKAEKAVEKVQSFATDIDAKNDNCISKQGEIKQRLEGVTLTDYLNALNEFGRANKLLSSASEVVDEARSSVKGTTLFNQAGLDAVAVNSLSKAYSLSSAAEDIFKKVNSAMAEIATYERKANKNRLAIEQLVKDIDADKEKLASLNESFTPYQKRYDAIKEGVQTILKRLEKDPKSALEDSQQLLTQAQDLASDLSYAVTP